MDTEMIPEEFVDTDYTPWTVRGCDDGSECERGSDDCPCPHPAMLEFKSHCDEGGGWCILCNACGVGFYLWLTGKGPEPVR